MAVEAASRHAHGQVGAASVRFKGWYGHYAAAVGAIDGLLILAAIVMAYVWRFGEASEVPIAGSEYPYGFVALFIAVLWWGTLEARDTGERSVVGHGLEEYRRVIVASVHAFAAVAILSYFLQAQLSRAFFLVLLPTGTVLLLVGRWAARQVLHALRRQGKAVTPTLVVGAPHEVSDTVRELQRNRHAGFKPVAVALPAGANHQPDAQSDALRGLPIVDIAAVVKSVHEHRVQAVVVTQGLSRKSVRRLAWSLEEAPVELMFVPSLMDASGPRLEVSQMQDLSFVSVELPRYYGWNHLLKRLFDIAFSGVALIVVSPVMAVIALLIKREDGGPVIFRQERIGLGGQPFTIHKFRTMGVDAESKIDAMIAAAGGQALLFKVEDDPRITKIGRILRKYSLDELPQFWTVLRGSMSVVGPRPQVEREVAEYTDDAHRRLLIKPGITGLWQVSGRSGLSVEESIRLDLRYVENWSLSGDVTIIMHTVRTVFRSDGAY